MIALLLLRIFSTISFRWKTLSLLTIGFALLDIAILLFQYDRHHRDNAAYSKKRHVFFALMLIVLLSSIPLFTDYLIAGHDLQFHLWRIEGIADGIRDGQFPVRLHPSTLGGYGYAAPVFYPELLLYFPAFLRLVGISIMSAYKVFLFSINVLTAMIAYFSFSRIFRSTNIGLIGSFAYTLSLYRLINLYTRAAVGEASAMAFLPLVLFGMFVILTAEPKHPSFRWSFLPLTIGMMGLISTHLLSCEIAALFLIITCLICIRRVLQPKRFLSLAIAAVVCILLSLCLIVPMMDYLVFDTYSVFSNGVSDRTIHAVNIAQLFPLLPSGSGESNLLVAGISGEMPLGVGFSFVLIIILFLVSYRRYSASPSCEKPCDRILLHTSLLCFILGLFALFMTTYLFPWYQIYLRSDLLANLAEALQFPWRMLSAATLLLSVAFCMLVRMLPAWTNRLRSQLLVFTICATMLFTAVAYCDAMLRETGAYRAYMRSDLDATSTIGCAEYMPTGWTDLSVYCIGTPISESESVSVLSFFSQGTGMTITAQNADVLPHSVLLPRIRYLGYTATTDDGSQLPLSKGDNCLLKLELPGQFDGTISIRFAERPIWRISTIISLLTGLGLAVYFLLLRMRIRGPLYPIEWDPTQGPSSSRTPPS
ncbi:MAG: hypothetical protein RR475_10890 [Clostridia bacterium]